MDGPSDRSTAGGAQGRALRLRVRSEFLEMPGLRITTTQAARLWAVDRATSARVLDDLVAAGFLWKHRDGAYLRASGDPR
jgi:DNA-binding MarR family transcriptional regulator